MERLMEIKLTQDEMLYVCRQLARLTMDELTEDSVIPLKSAYEKLKKAFEESKNER